jgi:hypothetical protein
LQQSGRGIVTVMKIANCGNANNLCVRAHTPPDEEGARCIPVTIVRFVGRARL